ncbi:MAG TPA: DUF4132 domain-containing protein [Gemmataceae bacterium]|nr:DUF4132 domain-containing protein [Gemmataceae bacterium]
MTASSTTDTAIASAGEETVPDWLGTILADLRKVLPPILPDWVRLADLPPLTTGVHRLNDYQVQAVLLALRKSTLAAPLSLVTALKEHVDRTVLDAFVWHLFEQWQKNGANSKDKWALLALGHLGGDGSALKLTPLLRSWPGESLHQRAVLGLECLRAIGTDTALMQLNSIAVKLRFRALQNKARQFMDDIAAARGLSRTQLEDRIVPDLDLDERGGRVFDFGPRRFHFVLGPDLKPLVRDEAGKLNSDLPKPRAKDDAGKAAAAVAAWKVLKKQVRETIKAQAYRLEQAMIAGRRWSVAEFESLLVWHPLMINLVRRLLWGIYDADRKLVRGFRVTEERDYADIHDNPCTLEGAYAVSVVHPLHLTPEDRSAWGQVFGDYEIIAPFPQLGRRVHTLEPGEESARELTRFRDKDIPALLFMGILKSHGWTDGRWQEGLYFSGHYKAFDGPRLTAVIEPAAGSGDSLRIKTAYFLQGADWGVDKALSLGQVDPVVLSEVLGTLGVLASKGT